MTAKGLDYLLMKAGYPKTYNVDADTYANVCQEIFQDLVNKAKDEDSWSGFHWKVSVSLGPYNNGIIFKNVELILRSKT